MERIRIHKTKNKNCSMHLSVFLSFPLLIFTVQDYHTTMSVNCNARLLLSFDVVGAHCTRRMIFSVRCVCMGAIE